jgi:ParB family chromosome partitioning protein
MTAIPIDDINVGARARRDLGDIDRLAQSIAEVGLLHPIVVNNDCRLIAGARRLKAVKSLGWEKVSVTVVPLDDIVRGEYAENTFRKDFLPSEGVEIGAALEKRSPPKQKSGRANAQTNIPANYRKVREATPATRLAKSSACLGVPMKRRRKLSRLPQKTLTASAI